MRRKGTGSGSFLLLLVIQVPVLDSYKPPIDIEVRNLQPVDALLIRPGSQSAPVHHSPVNLPLLEENLRAAWLSQGCSKNLAYLLASKEDFPELSPEEESPDEEPEEAPLPEDPPKEELFPEEESSSS